MDAQKNVWYQMALFNQKFLKNIIGGHQDLGTPHVIAAVATISNHKNTDTILFLDSETEALADLPDGRGLQTIVDVKALLEMLPQSLKKK